MGTARRKLTPKAFRGVTVFAVGHSTRSQEELIAMLWAHGVATLVDVRSFPRSRTNPQFNTETLEALLPSAGLGYEHVRALGGLRKGLGAESPNQAWRNKSFRAYADHMMTEEFEEGLLRLRELSEAGPPAVMCAEGMRWRCHRSLLSDALQVRGAKVFHIESEKRVVEHKRTPFAVVRGVRIRYPEDPSSPREAVSPRTSAGYGRKTSTARRTTS